MEFSKLRPPDAVRIKAKIVERNDNFYNPVIMFNIKNREPKKFCVDPQLTSFEVLNGLIGQAFGLNEEFQMSYLNRENQACNDNISNLNEDLTKCEYLSILNDWDLDAAFLYSSYPYLSLNITVTGDDVFKFDEEQPKPAEQSLNEEWDVISNVDLKPNSPKKKTNKSINSLSIDTNQVNLDASGRSIIALWSNTAADKAVSVFHKMIHGFSRSNSNSSNASTSNQNQNHLTSFNNSSNLQDSVNKSNVSHSKANAFDLYKTDKLKAPIGESEYRNFIDSDGRIIILSDLKQRIFDGGCESSRRKELWPILLDIYPSSQSAMSSQQRNEFIKLKSAEYINLKSTLWYNLNKGLLKKKHNSFPENEISILANKIQKDVWRTDRCHRFYSGDSNKNIESLFNILLTYSLANNGFYAQGMSDLLSPLLYVLRDEPLAFICFSSLMKRCSSNFDINSDAICCKIELLSNLISKYDPVLWQYLKNQGADQLLFVYRWLLIDCKREFPFSDSLRMFEVMWSTIEPSSLSNNDLFNCSENFFGNFYSRSSSNASSLNLRLFKNYLNRQNALSNILNGDGSASSNYVDDELISDVEYNNNGLESCSIMSNEKSIKKNIISTPEKSRHNHNTSHNNFLCEFCATEKSMNNLRIKKNVMNNSETSFKHSSDSDLTTSTDSSLDEDCLEALTKKRNRNKWKQNGRMSRCHNETKRIIRPRYLSLNLFDEDSCKEAIINNNLKSKLKQSNKEQCLTDIKNKKNRTIPCSVKYLVRSLSTGCIEFLGTNKSLRNKTTISNKNLFDTTNLKSNKLTKRKALKEVPIPILKSKIFIQPVSSPAKLGTSETGTIKYSHNNLLTSNMSLSNHLSSHEVRETNSNNDIDVSVSSVQLNYKNKKKFKKSSNSKINENLLLNNKDRSENPKINKCTCSNRSYIDNHDDYSINDKVITKIPSNATDLKSVNQKTDDLSSKNATTTTSSSGIGVSSSASSSSSSKCSTPFPQTQSKSNLLMTSSTTSSVIQNTSAKQLPKPNSFEDDEEEELIYSLSKQDNPFLLFICFAIFIEHRDHIINTHMDANDIACYFDKMTRKQNLKNILGRARYLYTHCYLSKTNVFNYLQQLNEIPLNSP